MREIKFRVFFYDGEDESSGEYVSALEAIGEGYIEFYKNRLVPTDKCSIIEQFTGLHDKKGKEIYEGDVVVWHRVSGYPDGFGAVVWDDVHAAFFILREAQGIDDTIYDFYNLQIIGNIHENQELLND